jgi:acetoin utilization deacetylase AcuC-like enzyme
MQILHNPSTLSHSILELVGSRLIPAYESPARISSILSALSSRPITHCTTDIDAALHAASKVHTADYLQHLRTIFPQSLEAGLVEPSGTLLPECFPSARLPSYKARNKTPTDLSARTGWYAFDLSSGIAEHTYTAALASADLARRGALAIADGEKTVFAMCRPPGHHCGKDVMGGYCYLNNTAIAVKTLLGELDDESQGQISILDLDFHHGNGTQEVFYADKNPAYVSIHGEGEYPYFSGAPEENGEGKGTGYNLNLPISCSQDVTWELYSPRMQQAIEKLKAVRTKYLVVSLGFDTFCNDPVGKFCLAREDYGKMGRIVGELGLPTLVVLEGGYVVEELGNNCAEFLRGLEAGKASVEVEAVEEEVKLDDSDKLDKTCEWEKVEKSEAVNGSYTNGYTNGYCNGYTTMVNGHGRR